MTIRECLEDKIEEERCIIANAKSEICFSESRLDGHKEELRRLDEPSPEARQLMDIIGCNCELVEENFRCGFEDYWRISIKIPNWVHDEYGYRARMNMERINEMGFYLGGVVVETPHQPELRFFRGNKNG